MAYAGVLAGREAGYPDRARALIRRAEALGATLASWSAVTLAFSWDLVDAEKAVAFAIGAVRDRREGLEPWASGIAQGSMDPLGVDGQYEELAWGAPLVEAVALARIAAPGEVLVDASVAALESGDLLAVGSKISLDSGRRVRGARLDLHQPWRSASAAQIAHLVEPLLVGRATELALLGSSPGAVTVLRADPGHGGSRMLAELAARTAPSSTLLLTPTAVKAEPLGALRRAFIHLAGSEPLAFDASLHEPLDRLLSGEGIPLDKASELVRAYLRSKGPPPALLIDDAIEIDGPSVEACLAAARASQASASVPWIIVVRLDALADVPSVFAALPHGADVELKPLSAGDAGQIAELAMKNALSGAGAARWARRGGFTPLGVLEAVTSGLASGELAWVGNTARARRRAGGKGTPRPAGFWIAQRAEELASEARAVLVAVALLGGSASLGTIKAVVGRISSSIDVAAEMPRLLQARWLHRMKDGWLALPTRSHREAVLQLMNDARSRAWHRAIAVEIEKTGGALQLAEAAQHAAKAMDGPWAARLAGKAAQRASELGQDTAAMRLVAFARAQDPLAIDTTSEVVEMFDANAKMLSIPPPGPLSIPPPPSLVPIPPAVTRMKAMDDLSRGRATQAVRTLRAELEKLGDASLLERSKGALALGLALAHAGETDEALLAALDGLARAREGGDARGERACMMLVARLLAPSGGDARRVEEALAAKG